MRLRSNPELAHAFVARALDALAADGIRCTVARRRIVEQLAAAEAPVNAYDVAAALKAAGRTASVMTVHRTLVILVRLQLVQPVLPSGKLLPNRRPGPGLHLHVYCRSCHIVEEVTSVGMLRIERAAAAASAFQIRRTCVTLVGVCPECWARLHGAPRSPSAAQPEAGEPDEEWRVAIGAASSEEARC